MTRTLQWGGLVFASAILVWAFKAVGVPAALLLGPLLAGIGFGLSGVNLRPHAAIRLAGQTVIGCTIAIVLGTSLDAAILRQIGPAAALSVSTLAIAIGLGWILIRLGWFDGPTVLWGLAPGASAAMVTLAEETGGDARTVAMMQYLRILLVACSAIVIAHLIGHPPSHARTATDWLPALDPMALACTAVFAIAAALIGRALKIPAGALLFTTLVGAALISMRLIPLQVPPLAAAAAYAVVGWNIGLAFTRVHLMQVARDLPHIVLAILLLMAGCAAAAKLAVSLFSLDPLTAYLASSPGGVDTILIISTATPVDLPFILGSQVMRFVLVVSLAPWLIAWMSRKCDLQRWP